MADPVRIFVSHHHSPEEDKFTARLVADLKEAGADVWVDDEGITSDDFVRKISEGLVGRQWLVLVMTPDALRSPWVQREVEAALNVARLHCIGFMITPCDPYDIHGLWLLMPIVDATQDYKHARSQLFRVLSLSAPADPSVPLPSPVRWGSQDSLPYTHEHVAFTSHYPQEVAPQVWDRLLVFIALDTAKAAAEVEAMAAERLQSRRDEFRIANAPTTTPLQRGTKLTIVPHLPGFRFDPASITTLWIDDVQCYEFRLRAEDATPGRGVNGQIAILEGPLLRGEIPLSIFVRDVRQPPLGSARFIDTRVAAYRNTFPSYSRKDEPIVRACETVAQASGDRFLRDVHMLRAGEEWAPKLLELIEQANVFQLFWSKNAAESHQVEREWRYALTLRPDRPNFIRPIYWSSKPYPIPPELQPIELGRLEAGVLGLARPSWLSRMMRHDG